MDVQYKPRGRPRSNISPEVQKQRHAEYMVHYYERNKTVMNQNARQSYLRLQERANRAQNIQIVELPVN